MPFTPAHPAAAFPLRRLWPWLPLDALVIGTMSPDFQYLLALAPRGKFGHTWAGLLLFCLPVSLACWLAFRALVRPALLPLVPPGLAGHDDAAGRISARTLRGAAVAALLGALTHVLWDGFTHEGGWAARLLPVLVEPAFTTDHFAVQWFTILQHASTLVGGAVMAAWVLGWLRGHPPGARRFAPGQRRRLAGFVALLLAGALAAGLGNALRAPDRGMRVRVGYGVVGSLAGLVAAAAAHGAWDRARRRAPG